MNNGLKGRVGWLKKALPCLVVMAFIGLIPRWSISSQISSEVPLDADDVGGVVVGASGPEAGVWVIAETTDLPTLFREIVVTDDQGRYLLPDLPAATYRIWVRGYGLVDSEPVDARPGDRLMLTAVLAADPQAAAAYYPPHYWSALIQVPPEDTFPLGEHENQAEWASAVKQCNTCHALGARSIRELSPELLAEYETSLAAWDRRVRSGQIGSRMGGQFEGFGRELGLKMFSDWTDRIAGGELPSPPPRPQGLERNVVLSMWEVSTETPFMHDVATTDKRNPQLNGQGLVYGVDFHHGTLVILNPNEHTWKSIAIPTLVDTNEMRTFTPLEMDAPSPYWGNEVLFADHQNPNNLMLDQNGRVWMATAVRGRQNPAWCREGSENAFAQLFPLEASTRHAAYYDPDTETITPIGTCFRTHHVRFADDEDNTAYFNGLGDQDATIGWINTRLLDETGDSQLAQGWCQAYFDINGDGRTDPSVDVKLRGSLYSVIENPVDKTIWAAAPGVPGKIFRFNIRDKDVPESCTAEVYELPFNEPSAPEKHGYFPRGIDADTSGLIWTALVSGHLASFDRNKCNVLAGEEATTGRHCPEGWTLYPAPGPRLKGDASGKADFFYYNWSDQKDVFGLGENTQFAAGSASDSIQVLRPDTGEWITLQIPYPLNGFNPRGMDGRIDDPEAGWKGRGLWAVNGTRASWLAETGRGTRAGIVHFRLRPNPLAK